MDLERLQLFVQVAEAGSLSKAAVLLDTMQSAVSRQVSALEKDVGKRLFDRTGRGVTLTEYGRRILPEVKALIAEASRVEALMQGKDEQAVGEVRLGLMPSVSELLVAALFNQLKERFPAIRLRIFEGSNGQLDEWVSTGRVDMAALYRYGRGTRRGEDTLFEVDTYLVGAPGDPLLAEPTLGFSRLDGLPLVLPGLPNGLRVVLDQLARRQKAGFSLNVVMEADSFPIQCGMARSGAAYAVHGGVVVARDVQAGLVSAARLVDPGIRRTMVLATTTHHPLSVACRETAKLVRRLAQDRKRLQPQP